MREPQVLFLTDREHEVLTRFIARLRPGMQIVQILAADLEDLALIEEMGRYSLAWLQERKLNIETERVPWSADVGDDVQRATDDADDQSDLE